MSENVKNENAKVVVIMSPKSPIIGFLLALFLGWLGIDRFYKGGIASIVLGIINLLGGLAFITNVFLFALLFSFENKELHDKIISIGVVYIVWCILDLIFVPLGIFFDNRRKLAIAKGANISTISKLDIAMAIIVAILILLFALPRFMADRTGAKVAVARSDMDTAQKAIKGKILADNINPKATKAPNPNNSTPKRIEWGKWIMVVSGLYEGWWHHENNGVYPVYKDGEKYKLCYNESKLPLLWINTRTGNLHFNPSKLGDNSEFCQRLRESYSKAENGGDRIIPLESTGTIKF